MLAVGRAAAGSARLTRAVWGATKRERSGGISADPARFTYRQRLRSRSTFRPQSFARRLARHAPARLQFFPAA